MKEFIRDNSGICMFMLAIIIYIAFDVGSTIHDKRVSEDNLINSDFSNEWISSNKIKNQDTTDYIRIIEVINKETGKKYKLFIHSVEGENEWYGIEEDN